MLKRAKTLPETELRSITKFVAYLLVVWGLYRFLFKLPEEVEELFVKPLIWLTPVIYMIFVVEKSNFASVGITFKNIFPSIYLSLGLGIIFALEAIFINFLKYNSFNFAANIGQSPFFTSFALTLATGFTEEITFRGYVFNRLWIISKSEIAANLVSSFFWALIHVPVAVFVWKFDLISCLTYLFLTMLFGVGSAFVFGRTKNVFSSVLLHVLWEWPIILFR